MEYLNEWTVSPERWLRLGYILGASENGGRISISSDEEDLSKLAADTIKIGVKYAGSKVYNFGEQNLPIMRHAVRFYKTGLGIFVNTIKGDNGNVLNVDLLDNRGIKVPLENLVKREELAKAESLVTSDITMGTVGQEVTLFEFKTHYMRHIINSIKSDTFNMNICLSTKSKTISEILKVVLDDLYSKIEPEALEKYEFSGIISENGEQINLYKSDGTELSREQILSVMIYVLLRDSSIRTFVVPDIISEYTETAILRLGGNVIRVSGGDSEIMEKIISSGSSEQMLMQFDGIYAAVKILDFLNRYDISFDSLTMHLPQIFKAEAEVACGDEKQMENIIKSLKRQFKNNATILGDSDTDDEKGSDNNKKSEGIKIESNGTVTIVFPGSGNNILKIISESESMETAEEISTLFKNKIKTLAKS